MAVLKQTFRIRLIYFWIPGIILLLLITMMNGLPKMYALDREPGSPVRMGIVGLVHTHVHGLLGRKDAGDIKIVGIVEPNTKLARRYAKQHGFEMSLVFDSLQEMLEETRPDAVAAFNSTYDHLEVVRVRSSQDSRNGRKTTGSEPGTCQGDG